jgi:hypothetical protein
MLKTSELLQRGDHDTVERFLWPYQARLVIGQPLNVHAWLSRPLIGAFWSCPHRGSFIPLDPRTRTELV